MSNPTFTNQEGERIKNISHKNLSYHAKDGGLLVKFKNTGKGQYGPYAFFNVDGDESGDYVYKPKNEANFAMIEAVKGKWVLVAMAQTNEDGSESLSLEDADGLPVLPDNTPQPGDFDHKPDAPPTSDGPGPSTTRADRNVDLAVAMTARAVERLKACGIPVSDVEKIYATHFINVS